MQFKKSLVLCGVTTVGFCNTLGAVPCATFYDTESSFIPNAVIMAEVDLDVSDILSDGSFSDIAFMKFAESAQSIYGSSVSSGGVVLQPIFKLGSIRYPMNLPMLQYNGSTSIGRAIQLNHVSSPPPLVEKYKCNPNQNKRLQSCCEECGATDDGWLEVSHLLNRGYINKNMELIHKMKVKKHILYI